ncbi:hypothetical protein D1BOALGB6SA_8091 [Olavius sp. associated proteobacterium Delta 1]|nr:hypothetical protein D1BOALGB6SA_8091 [Olavius sp. associated proteobacterium Delta 1]
MLSNYLTLRVNFLAECCQEYLGVRFQPSRRQKKTARSIRN